MQSILHIVLKHTILVGDTGILYAFKQLFQAV
jgi:hypothetical protein